MLAVARELQRARDFHELFELTLAEVKRTTGYQTIWFAVLEHEGADMVRIIDTVGAHRDWFYDVFDEHQLIPVAGDKLIEEILRRDKVVVVEDARVDPRTNKAIVEALGSCTIINVPLALIDKPFGALGTGTFVSEGPRPPTPEMIAQLTALASLVSVAASRLRFESHNRKIERERRETEMRIARLQRLDSIGVLAGGVAHDFNNLLTVVSAACSLARRARTPERLEMELATIEDVVARGMALTRQLLAVSRAQTLMLRDVALGPVLADVVPLVRRVIPDTIEIDARDDSSGSFVEADRGQLDQVIINLCLNARDAMPDGGRLAITTAVVDVDAAWAKPGKYVVLSIADTGHGIAKEHLDRIFEPFFTTKGERSGTGLGLSVAQGIVRQHGGTIRCHSEAGVGTTFEVYLPALARLAEVDPSSTVARVRGGDERILVGDDDDAVRGVVTRVLESAGYTVRGVASGRDVIRALEADEFELLLLDVVMPGIACRNVILRARALRPDLRIVLASGYSGGTNATELVRALQLPMLPKPYGSDDLLRAVRATLDG